MTEQEVIANWVSSRLSGASGVTALVSTRIYPDVVPGGVAIAAGLPYITHNQQSDVAQRTIGSYRHSVVDLWAVQCWVRSASGPGSYAPIELLATQVDLALDRQFGAATGGEVAACVREQVMRSTPDEQPAQARRIILLYRIIARAT